jgi:hypothetical protein
VTLIAPLEIEDSGVMRRAVAADFVGPAGPAGPPGAGAAIQAAGVDQPTRAKLNFTGSLTVADDSANDRINVSVDISGLATVAALAAETSARAAADATLVTLAPATAARNTIQPTADAVPLTLKGFSGQTANLQEWRDSANALKLGVDVTGGLLLGDSVLNSPAGGLIQASKGFQASFDLKARTGATTVLVGNAGPAAESGISFQNGEMSLYRSSSTVLATSNAMLIVKKGTPDEIRLGSGGLIQMGASGDVNLQRDAAGSMTLFGGSARARFIVKGFSGQTDNLQEWQNSAGTVAANITPAGSLIIGGSGAAQALNPQLTVATFSSGWGSTFSHAGLGSVVRMIPGTALGATNGDLEVQGSSTGSIGSAGRFTTGRVAQVGLVVQGIASQTGDLQQWQDSTGAVKGQISSNGSFVTTGIVSGVEMRATYYEDPGNVAGYLQMNFDSTHAIVALPKSATRVPFTVRGFASQSANLQEWQDSGGAVVARIGPSGNVLAAYGNFGNAITANTDIQAQVNAGEVSIGNMGPASQKGMRLGPSFGVVDTYFYRAAAGVMALGPAGGGLRLTSPDGLTTKTLTLDNTGALDLA